MNSVTAPNHLFCWRVNERNYRDFQPKISSVSFTHNQVCCSQKSSKLLPPFLVYFDKILYDVPLCTVFCPTVPRSWGTVGHFIFIFLTAISLKLKIVGKIYFGEQKLHSTPYSTICFFGASRNFLTLKIEKRKKVSHCAPLSPIPCINNYHLQSMLV